MGRRTTLATDVGELAGTMVAPRQFVETEAVRAWSSVVATGHVSLGAICLAVAGAGTHKTVRLSKSGKRYHPQL